MAISLRNWIQKLVIDTHIWVSLNCAFLSATLQLWYYERIDWNVISVLFWVCMTGYSYYSLAMLKIEAKIVKQSRFWGFVICIVFLASSIAEAQYFFTIERKWIFLILSLLSIFYQSPFVSFSIRKIPYAKIFYIAMMWTLWVLFFSNHLSFYPLYLPLYLFILSMTIPFDIRDLGENELTIPQQLGKRKSTLLALFLFWTVVLIIPIPCQWVTQNIAGIVILVFIISILILAIHLLKDNKSLSFYISFVIEGIPTLVFLYFYFLITH